jgi:acyl carrier protein
LLPRNVVGEIYVASPGLARGYLGDAALTSRRFVEVSLPGEPTRRMYRTGDLGRLSTSGDLCFVGRVDKQVKIRGNRVELEEIEKVLADHPSVQRNVVTLQRSQHGVEQLVAHVELRRSIALLDQERSLYLYTLAQRPELARALDTLHTGAWPEYFLYDDHVRNYWARMSDAFADYQLALVDRENVAVAVGNAVPIAWNGEVDDLPQGWDDGLRRAFELREAGGKADTLMILAAVIAEEHQARGVSTLVLEAFKRLGAAHGLQRVVVPVRPTGAVTRPDLAFSDWCALRRDDGMPADHWLRSHERVGGRVLRISHQSQCIVAPVEAWERWAGTTFPASGDYRVPGALQPVSISLEEGVGRYYDPSVWMQHFYDGEYTWRPTDARALRTFVQEQLPPYMVPEHIRFIPEMPMAESGKIDERRLPAITIGSIEERSKVPPQTDVERALVRIWIEVLGVDDIGVLDDFYELGGHSIAAVRTLVKLQEELGVSIRLRDFFRERTIMGISRLIENRAS